MNRTKLRAFRDELAFFSQFVEPNMLCFDVGANYGDKSEVFLRLGAKVIAFEPQPDCFNELRARLGPNPRLVSVNAAVGSSPGRTTMYVERHRTASSLLKDWQGEIEGSIEVPVTTLDNAIAKYGTPHYCKIDVEGYELEVLKGLSHEIPVLSYEYHLGDGKAEAALACLEYLSSKSEVLVNITPAEKPVFGAPEWLEKSEFIAFFRNRVPHMQGYGYGDIFVKTRNGGETSFQEAQGNQSR
jgi:FkbM family methyltransferase